MTENNTWEANRLKRMRQYLGVSKQQLANELGVSRQTIDVLERRNGYFSNRMIVQLSNFWELKKNELLKRLNDECKYLIDL